MKSLIECIPNISEGRRGEVVAAIRDAALGAARDVLLLDSTSDPDHNRSVFTFLGDGPAPFHRIAELWFEDPDAFEVAKESPELEAAASDVAEMEARFGVKLHSPAGISVDAELGPFTPAS